MTSENNNPYQANVSQPVPHDAGQETQKKYDALTVKIANLHTVKKRSGYDVIFLGAITLINIILVSLSIDLYFPIGIGGPLAMAANADEMEALIALATVIGSALLLIATGILGRYGQSWALVIAIVIYGLDTVILAAQQDWIAFGLHLFILMFVVAGSQAGAKIEQLESERAALGSGNPKD